MNCLSSLVRSFAGLAARTRPNKSPAWLAFHWQVWCTCNQSLRAKMLEASVVLGVRSSRWQATVAGWSLGCPCKPIWQRLTLACGALGAAVSRLALRCQLSALPALNGVGVIVMLGPRTQMGPPAPGGEQLGITSPGKHAGQSAAPLAHDVACLLLYPSAACLHVNRGSVRAARRQARTVAAMFCPWRAYPQQSHPSCGGAKTGQSQRCQ